MTEARNITYGIAMMLIASGLIAAATLTAKLLGTGATPLHPFQISAGRFFFALMGLLAASLVLRPTLRSPNLPLHLGRVLAGWLGVTAMFAAATKIPLADATAISFLNPVVAMVLAIPLLGERVGKIRWLAAILALLGGLLVIKPGTTAFHPAALVALGGACVMGLEIIFIKRLTKREPPLQILLINNALGALIACLVASQVWQTPTPQQWAQLVTVGLVMVTAQSFFIQSMRSGEASLLIPFSYATLIFAGLYDLLIFSVLPDIWSCLGILIILCAGVTLAIRENRKR